MKTLTIPDSGQRTVQELVRIVFARMYTRKKRRYISKKDVLKILFQAKERLSDGSPIKDALPYYWYKNGPYSTLIYKVVDDLQTAGMITKSNSRYKTYLFDRAKIDIPLTRADAHMAEAKSAITDIVDEFTHIEALVGDVYDDAPYRWYDTYNLKFKVRFNNFCDTAASARGNAREYILGDILNALEDAVLDFPPFPNFPELRRTFMRFARLLNSFLQTDGCMEHKDVFLAMKDISNAVWDVFAYGVRIKFHDAYYDGEVGKWIARYKEELAKLDADLLLRQKKIERVCAYEAKVAPRVADMKRHPEKYGFEELKPRPHR